MLLIWIGIGLILAVIVAFGVMAVQGKSKKDAIKILEAGQITDWKDWKRTLDVLALMTDDLQAIKLYKDLQELADRQLSNPVA